MFKKSRVPVRVFSSADNGAPRYDKSKAGNIFDILKACLVDGYGDKAGLGWECKFPSGKSGIFMPTDKKQTDWGLKLGVDSGRRVQLSQVRLPTSFESDAGSASMRGNAGFFCHNYQNGYEHNHSWYLVGHALGFVLVLTNEDRTKNMILYFGKVPSLAAADDHNYLLWYTTSESYEYLNESSFEKYPLMARDRLGISYAICQPFSKASHNWMSDVFPDPICNGFWSDDVYLAEYTENPNGWRARAYLSGILHVRQYARVYNMKTLSDLDGTGDDFLFVMINAKEYASSAGDISAILINLTAWEV